MIGLLDLGAADYASLGAAHGDAWGEEACALFGIRFQLTRDRSAIDDLDRIRSLAQAHVGALRDFHPGLYEELRSLSDVAGLNLWQSIILNHYTDFRDIPDDGGCSALYVPLPFGPVIAQTWDMHGSAEPFVRLVRLEPPDGPPVVTFTLTGCLGMTGLNAEGVAVCINNLTPDDARVGVAWPALVRRMLLERTADAALQVLMDAPLSSGHNYLIADESAVYNVETTGGQKRVTARRTGASAAGEGVIFHTNHYLDPDLVALQKPLHPATTTHERYDALCRLLASAPESLEELKAVLGSHDGYPRSVCSHVGGDEPSASKTCGGVICDLKGRRMLAQSGCLHGAEYRVVAP